MKPPRFIPVVLMLLLTASCAVFTGECDKVARDEFLYKIPLLNEQILGNLKYDDSALDLRTLPVTDYAALFDRMELTSDDRKVIANLRENAPEQKFLLQQDTFLVCVHSPHWQLILCDDAATPGADRVVVEQPLPALEVVYGEFLREGRE